MADKIILDNVAGTYDVTKINANFVAIQEAMNERVLFRDDLDSAKSDLDMNSNRILNLPAPLSANEPARKGDVVDIAIVQDIVNRAEAAADLAAEVAEGLGDIDNDLIEVRDALAVTVAARDDTVEAAESAATSASAASSSASSASGSASSASTSASTANTRATAANTSATNAATSATNAGTSATNANTSALLAEQWASKTLTPVSSGKYSAFYEAERAKGFADQASAGQIQSDWNTTDTTAKSYIQNKPNLDLKANVGGSQSQQFIASRLTAYHPGNSIYMEGAVNGVSPGFTVAGSSDTNIGVRFSALGNGEYDFRTAAARTQFKVGSNAAAVNNFIVYGAATGASPVMAPQGTDTNIGLDFRVKGAGEHIFRGVSDAYQFVVTNTVSAVNFPLVRAAATGGTTVFGTEGTDTNINVAVRSKGTGNVTLTSAGGSAFIAQGVASGVNLLAAFNGIAGQSPRFEAVGSDANINVRVAPKGTGNVIVDTGVQARVLSLQDGAPILSFVETDQTGATGVWRFVADGGTFRMDMNTSTARAFATYTTPFTITAAGVFTVATRTAGDSTAAAASTEFVTTAVANGIATIPPATSSRVLVGSATLTTSAAFIDFPTVFTNDYDTYQVEVRGLRGDTASTVFFMRFYGSAGTLLTNGYGSGFYNAPASSATYNAAQINFTGSNSPAFAPFNADLTITNVKTTEAKHVWGFATAQNAAGTQITTLMGTTGISDVSVLNGLRLYLNVGTCYATSALPTIVRVWGLKKA